ncbi:MAG: hypothetical protein EOO75_04520, partial [Myxococcales bacterium]
LRHRGPDASGLWFEGPIGLAHTRLSIVDLSERGAQPMASSDDAWRITFNGEIYNHRRLRSDLEAEGVRLRGTSDTEVGAQAAVVVDFAVEGDAPVVVGAGHRLGAALGQVDDAQAGMGEADGPLEPQPRRVRAAVAQGAPHGLEVGALDHAVGTEDASDAAHAAADYRGGGRGAIVARTASSCCWARASPGRRRRICWRICSARPGAPAAAATRACS